MERSGDSVGQSRRNLAHDVTERNKAMNTGTKIRTAAFAIACVNQAIASVGAVDLGNATANMIYNIISLSFTIIAGAFALYYNNDFTVEGMTGTQITREMKALRNQEYSYVEEPDDSFVIEESEVSEDD